MAWKGMEVVEGKGMKKVAGSRGERGLDVCGEVVLIFGGEKGSVVGAAEEGLHLVVDR